MRASVVRPEYAWRAKWNDSYESISRIPSARSTVAYQVLYVCYYSWTSSLAVQKDRTMLRALVGTS